MTLNTYTHLGLEDATDELKRMEELADARKELIKAILNMLLSVKRGKMLNNNGSEWKKWDFHVHTPYSILNNNYGFDPYTDVDNENKFDEFVQKLFLKALKNNVHAIGITDDFVIDGYKSIKERYLGCPEKMEILFPNEEFSASTYISTRCG